MIRVRELIVRRGGQPVLDVPSLDVEPGARLCVRGGNGTGKSTLMRVLAGLLAPTDGLVDVAALPEDRVLVHQTPYLLRGDVRVNLRYGLRARGVGRAETERRVATWIERFDLAPLVGRDLRTASGGERRRIALARALLLAPRVLLLDEPLADLDDIYARKLGEALEPRSEMTVVLTSPTGLPTGWSMPEVRLERPAATQGRR